MSAIIELNGLTKDYGRFRALQDLSLEIPPGVTGLLGPNGAGKSTLIKVLLGLVSATSGEGRILQHRLGTENEQIRMQIGYMPEDDCYMQGLSGIESIQVAAQLSRMSSSEALRRGHEILDFCGIGQERYRNVETYSTGMRQKLRFACAIVHDPLLLILDEPTSGLDPDERQAMLNRIRILSRQFGKSVILCTHILPDVQVVCESVVILAGGRIRLAGPLETLCSTPNPSLTVQVVSGAGQLATALEAPGLRTEEAGPLRLRVYGEPAAVNAVLWKTAAANGIVIRSAHPSRNSLEQVFLEAVREVEHAHS
ncbi:MAG: ABC transporter ATP-binding protein [Planctomycetaceae bacterium]|nr:ABC transporter ATP-binding protein [Planctomycetaceae bacterium]